MDERELVERLGRLKQDWREAPPPPLDAMWNRIEAEAFPQEAPRRIGKWIRTLLPLAATLVLGFGLGQVAPPLLRGGRPAAAANAAAPEPGDGSPARHAETGAPFVGIATDYLERVTALLVTLAEESRRGAPLRHSTDQAQDLLATTRLLMDAPGGMEPHLFDLLEDLELVLAQIVRLPNRPAAPDVYLIDQALDQRDVLPRLRVYLAEHPGSMP